MTEPIDPDTAPDLTRSTAARAASVASSVSVEELVGAGGEKKLVGDGRNLLGFPPRLFQYPQFAFQRPAFLLLVKGHFQSEAGGLGHVADVPLPAHPAPLFPLGHIGEEPAGVAARFDSIYSALYGGAGATPIVQEGDDGGRPTRRASSPANQALLHEVTPKSWTPDLRVYCAAQPSR